MEPAVTAEPRRRQVAAARALLVLGFLAFWQLIASAHVVDTFWISSPILVLQELWTLIESGELFAHVGMTVLEALIAFVVSSALGIAVVSCWRARRSGMKCSRRSSSSSIACRASRSRR